MKQRAVFIDRDGTISEEVGYINDPAQLQVFPYSANAIKLLNDRGWLAIVITNQSGVARGYLSEEMLQTIHQRLSQDLSKGGAHLDATYYCAHHPSIGEPPYRFDCDCRKPKPGLIFRAAKDFNIDLAGSWMIGDRYLDVEMAGKAGLQAALVMTGLGRGEWENQRHQSTHQPDLTAENLLGAVEMILTETTGTIA
jgi:D-glycero-D-manno-heptose 1,7-bisphosphate phosphatase